jgi:hypothetical protein
MRRIGAVLAALLVIAGVAPADAAVVDFSNIAPTNQQFNFGLSSGGFDFIHGPDSDTFLHLHAGRDTFWPWNGTSILLPHGDVIMTRTGGGLFDVCTVDLAGWPYNVENPIHAVGTKADSSTVTQVFTLDGFADGSGGLADFETFVFNSSFTGLVSLRFLVNGTGKGNVQGLFGIDNICVDECGGRVVPEPASLITWTLGIGLAFVVRRRKRS